MKLHRVSVKYFVDDPAVVDLPGMIPVFHGWIQQSKVPGMLIDVADYLHVPTGPKVVLVGHEVEYAMDTTSGRLGLLHTRKRCGDEDLAESVAGAFHTALLACRTLQEDSAGGNAAIRFRTGEAELTLTDRLNAPNRAATFDTARGPIETVLASLYDGAIVRINRDDNDERHCLKMRVSVNDPLDLATLTRAGA